MSGNIVHWSIVLVGFSICRVGIQSVLELRVALIELPSQHLIPIDKSLTKLGCCVSHFFPLRWAEAVTDTVAS